MLRTTLVAGAAAVLLALPALAQNSMSAGSSSNGMNGTMSNGNMSNAQASTMTCDQMMAKEQEHSANGTGAKLTVAQNETAMANKARSAGDEAGCKMHMQNAINALK
jgi:hypothetical protein